MKDLNIAIVGVGALGSHLLLLGRNWDAKFSIVDFDRIEAKNIAAQFHTKMGQGKNKAKALQSLMQSLFGLKVAAFTSKLGKDNRVAILSGHGLIVDCTDNFEARECLQGFARDYEVPCLHACLSAEGDFARLIWTEHFVPDAEGEPGQATCEDGRILPFFAAAAAFTATIVQRFLETGQKQSWQLTSTSPVRLA